MSAFFVYPMNQTMNSIRSISNFISQLRKESKFSQKMDLKFIFLISILVVLSQIQCSFCQPTNPLYKTCEEPYKCGDDDKEHGYPFWGNNRPAACGYPGFELNCQGGAALLNISGVFYRVLSIEESEHRLTVARQDMWEDVCRPEIIQYNTTLNFNLFSFFPASDYRNITLNYGCVLEAAAQPPVLTPESALFNCSWNGLTRSTLVSTPEASVELERIWRCDGSVMVPVDRNTASGFFAAGTSAVTVQTAVQVGFSVQWSAENGNCQKCRDSGGECGYNLDSESFACHCTDRTYSFTCNEIGNAEGDAGSGSSKTGLVVGLAIAGAVLASIGVALLAFYCKQRRKRQIAAVFASQTASTETTITSSSKRLSSTPSSTNIGSSDPSYPSSMSELDRGSMYFGVHVFNYTELEKATDNFDPSRELGDGGFGTVYYGILGDGRAVAVKRLYENNVKRADQFMNEVHILTRLSHQNLVKLYGCTSKRSRELLLVYEYIPNGTVADHLHGKRSKSRLLPWPTRLSIALETADALAYLHRSKIIHRDVKTNNVLLDNDFHVKVADFGLSRLFPAHVTHVSTSPQGTPGYVDPEYFQSYTLTEKSDVYSFGVMLMELISSLPAVDTSRHRLDINLASMAVNKIQNGVLNELVDSSLGFESDDSGRRTIRSVAEVAFRCLQRERDARPGMEEVLESLRGIHIE